MFGFKPLALRPDSFNARNAGFLLYRIWQIQISLAFNQVPTKTFLNQNVICVGPERNCLPIVFNIQ